MYMLIIELDLFPILKLHLIYHCLLYQRYFHELFFHFLIRLMVERLFYVVEWYHCPFMQKMHVFI